MEDRKEDKDIFLLDIFCTHETISSSHPTLKFRQNHY